MKDTILNYLYKLPDKYRSKAISNHTNKPKYLSNYAFIKSMADAINYAFDWNCTPEGFEYWADIYAAIQQGRIKEQEVQSENYSIY